MLGTVVGADPTLAFEAGVGSAKSIAGIDPLVVGQ
jgi:hypothetical protein